MFDDRILLAKKAAWENRFLSSVGLALQADAARNTTVVTGNLKNSINWKTENSKGSFGGAPVDGVTFRPVGEPKDSVTCGSSVKYANIYEIKRGNLSGALDNVGAQISKLISAAGDL